MAEETKVEEQQYAMKYIDWQMLRERCQQSIDSFRTVGETVTTPDGIYIFKDNKAPILAVAHLDVVKHIQDKPIFYYKDKSLVAPQLDDRLGVYLILDVLPEFGLNYDILLTENEEIGRSTAKYFETTKKYNWMFEIDRGGLDTVMYQYETPEKRALLKQYGFEVGNGSFTDIRYLEHLSIFGVNFACAYYLAHTVQCRVSLPQLEENLLPKIIKFIGEQAETSYPHEKKVYTTTHYTTTYYGGYAGRNREDKDYDDGYAPVQPTEKKKDWKVQNHSNPRYKYDTINGLHCPKCMRHYTDCVGPECTGNKNIKCKICTDQTCPGYVKCSCCGYSYHRNKFVIMTGYCRDCLADIFNVDTVLLNGAYSINMNIQNECIRQINESIGKVITNEAIQIYA